MAGHSKFKNIQFRKGAQDKKRAVLFSKLSKEITVAAKMGMPDPNQNARLRSAIQVAKAASFPRENIERAIKKSSDKAMDSFEEIRYEGFGPAGTSVIVEALTDNRNRSAADVRAIFQKNGGNFAESGSVSHQFIRYGFLKYPTTISSQDNFFSSDSSLRILNFKLFDKDKFFILIAFKITFLSEKIIFFTPIS